MAQSALRAVPRQKRDSHRFRRRRPRGRGAEGQAAGRWPTEQNLGRQVEKVLQNRAFRPTMSAKLAHRQLGICPCDDAKAEAKQQVCALWIAEACQKLASSRSPANDRAFWLRRCRRNVGTRRRCEALLGASRRFYEQAASLRATCPTHLKLALRARGAIGKIALQAY